MAQAVRWHRGGVALLALFVAVVAGLSALLPSPVGEVSLVVAARALPPGVPLTEADLSVMAVEPSVVPDGAYQAVDELVGRPLSVGVTRGTPITSAVMTADALTDHAADEVLVPFRVRDPDVVALLRVGDRLTIVTSTSEGTLQTVAEHVRVAQLPPGSTGGLLSGGSTSSGALIVVAAPRDVAAQLAGAGSQWLGVIIE